MNFSIKIILAFSLTLVMQLFVILEVHAQDEKQEKKNDNEFLKQALGAVPEKDKLVDRRADTVFQAMPRTILPAVGKVKEGENKERTEKESEEIKSTIVQQLPMLGQQVLLGSDAVRKMYDQGIDGPLSLHKITANMLEPAVAAGAQGAEITTALMQANMYHSQSLRWSEYMADPDLYRNAMNSFQGCMAKKTGDTPNSGSWVKALQECSGDSVLEQLPSGWSTASAREDAVFNAKYHSVFGQDGQETTVKISDMLFKQLNNSNLTPKEEPFKNKEGDWIKWFGDYELEIKPAGTQQQAFPKIQGVAKRKLPEKSTEDLIDEMTTVSGKQIFQMLKKYCEYRDKIKEPKRVQETFSDQGDVQDLFRQLSLPQKTFNMAQLNLFWDIAIRGFGKSQKECNGFQWKDNGGGQALEKLFQTIVKNYSEIIAQGHLINSWLVAEQFVARRTAGMTFDGQTREYAFRLIYDLAKTDNLLELVSRNLQVMDNYYELLLNYTSLHYGAGGTVNQNDVGARNIQNDR